MPLADASVAPSPDVAESNPLQENSISPTASPNTPAEGQPKTPAKVVEYFKSSISLSKAHRRQFSSEWKRSVDLRLGRIAQVNTNGYPITDGDDLQTEINPDWYLTKTKTANLYSQTPQVQLSHENSQYAAAVPIFGKSLNYELSDRRANIGVPMEETLNDVINAAGVGAIMVGYAARFETVQVPSIDLSPYSPEQQQALQDAGLVQMIDSQRATDYRFYTTRISPTDLLWPAAFTGSNFNDADWIGHTGRMGWASAKLEFKLDDAVKEQVISGEQRDTQDDLRAQPEKGALMAFETVKYDEIFYWRSRVDPDEKNFKSIWRMVFIHGMDGKPVIDEQWYGQTLSGKGLVGATKFPIQFLTLTYITDNPVPPSDSAAARPQVNDLRRSRQQYFMNRQRSRPVRWFDVNRVDRLIQDNLMRGDFQGFIPTNGPGDRAIGEIVRAAYPPEDMAFDRTTNADLQTMWMLGSNQLGQVSSGEHTAAEVQTIQANAQTRIGQERALVQKFFLNCVEVLAGLMALYSDFPNLTDQERQTMLQAWNGKQVLGDLVFSVRPDSTVLLDASQRIDRLTKFLNITAASGVVNIQAIIEEIAELSGLDPSMVMKDPPPPKPDDAAVSFRFTGKEDLYNPVVLALLVKQGQAPSPQDLQTAEQILMAAQQAPMIPPPPGAPGVPGAPPMASPGGPPPPGAPPVTPGEPNSPDKYGLAPKIAQRSEDMGNA